MNNRYSFPSSKQWIHCGSKITVCYKLLALRKISPGFLVCFLHCWFLCGLSNFSMKNDNHSICTFWCSFRSMICYETCYLSPSCLLCVLSFGGRLIWCTNFSAHLQSKWRTTLQNNQIIVKYTSFVCILKCWTSSYFGVCIRAPLVSTPVWGRDFASPEDLITEFGRECRIVRKGIH